MNWIKIVFINISILILSFLGIYFISIYLLNLHENEKKIQIEKQYSFLPYNNDPDAKIYLKQLFASTNEYKSFVGWQYKPYQSKYVNFGKDGVRLTPVHPKLKDDYKTAIFLGASVTLGAGSDDNRTIPAYFAKLTDGNYRAFNYGQLSYSAFQSYIFLSKKIAQGVQPNIVYSLDGLNQARLLRKGVDSFEHSREKVIQRNIKERSISYTDLFEPISLLIRQFRIDDVNKPNKAEQSFDYSDDNILRVAKETIESWRLTNALAKTYNFEYRIILLPNSAIGNPKLNHLKNIQSFKSYQKYTQYKKFYNVLKQLLESPENNDIAQIFYDFSGVFDIDEVIYIDHAHFSPKGNMVIAKKIVELLEQNK